MWLLRTLPNNVLGHIGIRHGLKGPNACITNHSVGGLLAVIEAAAALRDGEADRAVAVGHERRSSRRWCCTTTASGLLAPKPLRPFDARRDGSQFGEGAGALMLETRGLGARARRAGARRGARRRLCHRGRRACSPIRDDGDGPARAIAPALDDAGLAAADVGMIVAHGNGTPAIATAPKPRRSARVRRSGCRR